MRVRARVSVPGLDVDVRLPSVDPEVERAVLEGLRSGRVRRRFRARSVLAGLRV